MAKACWVSAYRAVKDAEKLAAYAKLAGPAIAAGGGQSGLRQIYKPATVWKAGVMLLDLQDSSVEQSELDLDDPGPDRGKLMGTLDALNTRYGRGSIQLAIASAGVGVGGADRTWTMRQELKTPNYTTCWKDLPRARALASCSKISVQRNLVLRD